MSVPFPSSLTDAEATIQKVDSGACFLANDPRRSAPAKTLEARAVAIDGYVRDNLPQDAYYRRVTLGPTYFRQLVNPLPASAPLVVDWNELGQKLDALADTPIDTQRVSFNESARSLFVDDWSRLLDGLDDTPSGAASRARPGIANRNDGVTRDGGTFHVKLDAGAFQGVEDALRSLIEPVWSDDSHRLVVDFVTGDPLAFRIVLDETSGGRSFVSWGDRTVHLYPGVRERSIAHEIGHVLGFRDHYETVFDGQSCAYTQTADPNDIMADAARGSVTVDEWSQLAATY